MPRPRWQRLEGERQEAILVAAATEFAEHGFRGASLNRILAGVGVSKGAFYYYFDDKADLFATVFSLLDESLISGVGRQLDQLTAETFWPRVLEVTREFLALTTTQPWVLGMAKAFYSMEPEDMASGPLVAYLEDRRQWLARLIDRGQAVGALRSDLPAELLGQLAFAVGSVFDRWLFAHWDELGPAELDRFFDLSFDTMRRTLSPSPSD